MNKELEIALQTHDLDVITKHFFILCEKFNEQIINNNKSEIYDFFIELEKYKHSKSDYFNYLLITSAENGFSHLLEILLNEKKVNPSYESNLAIIFANNAGFYKNVDLLWLEPDVKESLLFDDEALYNDCLKKECTKKIKSFLIMNKNVNLLIFNNINDLCNNKSLHKLVSKYEIICTTRLS